MNFNESEVGFEVEFEDSSAVKHQIPDNAAEIFCAIKINDGGMPAAVTEGGGALDFIGKDHLTPLAMAVMANSLDCVQVLLDGGAKTEIAVNGFTRLYIAAKYGRTGAAALLIERGADLAARNEAGIKPADLARHYDCLTALRAINAYLKS